jgi:predicted outer membrane protein
MSTRRAGAALLVSAALLCVLTVAACVNGSAPTHTRTAEPSGPASLLQANPISIQDRAYLQQAHQTNLAEIAAGTMAEQKGNSAAVKDLGKRLVTDHTNLDQTLQKAASAEGVELPTSPNAQQQTLAQQYGTATGSAFDRLFVTTQLTGHMQAMQAGQTEIADGMASPVKLAARAAAPIVAAHAALLDQTAKALNLPLAPSPSPS